MNTNQDYQQEQIDKIKELELLHKALLIDESTVVHEGLNRLSLIGNIDSIRVLTKMICDEKEFGFETEKQIIYLLNNKVFENGMPVMIEEIGKYIGKRNCRYLISSCWEVNYDCTKFIKEFSLIASYSNTEELLECLSVFENLKNPPPLDDVFYAINQLEIARKSSTNEINMKLLEDCIIIISSFKN